MSHSVAVTKRVTAGIVLVLGALFFQAGVASAQTPQQQLAEVKAQLEQLSAQFNTPSKKVLGVATTSAGVMPACTVTTDKDSYVFGETIVINWTATNSKTVFFMRDAVKDNLAYPTEKLKKNGSIAIDASVTGKPVIELAVTSKTGDTAVCSKTISITKKGSGEDKEVKKLRKQLEQVQKKIEAVRAKILQLTIDELLLGVEEVSLKRRIAELTGEPVDDPEEVEGIYPKFLDSSTESEKYASAVTFNVNFEVTAGEDTEAYIGAALNDESVDRTRGGAVGIFYRVLDSNGKVAQVAYPAVASIQSSADEDGEYLIVPEGETEDFLATVSFQPLLSGTYHLEVTEIKWRNNSMSAPYNTTSLDTKVFRTKPVNFIQYKG